MPQSQFTWKGEKSRALAVKRPCDCGCDQRDGGHGVGYLTGSDAEGNGVTVWIQDEQVFQALRALVGAEPRPAAAAPESRTLVPDRRGAIDYARQRADQTRTPYLVSKMGHVLPDLGVNLAAVERDLGGLHARVHPKRPK